MRKYGPVITAIALIVAVVAGFTALYYGGQANFAEDQLKVLNAKVATGSCGNQQIVVIDEERVAVAGRIFRPNEASTLLFSGGPENLRVTTNSGGVIMDRKAR